LSLFTNLKTLPCAGFFIAKFLEKWRLSNQFDSHRFATTTGQTVELGEAD